MKKNILFLLTLVCSLSFFTACSSDDDDKKKNGGSDYTELEGNYSGDKFQLTYSGSPLLGKEASFKADNTKGDGIITLKNIIPGEATTELNITFEEQSKAVLEKNYFSDEAETTSGAKVKYTGFVAKDLISLSLTDIIMPINELTGTWNLNTDKSIHFIWEGNRYAEDMAYFINNQLPFFLTLLFPEFSLSNYVESFSFKEDGNVVISYREAGDPIESAYKTSPLNFAHYCIKENDGVNKIQAYVSLKTILSTNRKNSRSISELMELVENGAPVGYTITDNDLSLFLDFELIEKIFTDEELRELIKSFIEELEIENEEAQEYIEELIENIGAAFDETTRMEIGINLIKK